MPFIPIEFTLNTNEIIYRFDSIEFNAMRCAAIQFNSIQTNEIIKYDNARIFLTFKCMKYEKKTQLKGYARLKSERAREQASKKKHPVSMSDKYCRYKIVSKSYNHMYVTGTVHLVCVYMTFDRN